MDKDEEGCRGASSAVNIELLDLGRSIREALGLADARTGQFAVLNAALDQLLAVRRIRSLVVSGIECSLIVIEKYSRPFFRHRTPVFCAALPIGLPKGEEVPKFITTTARRRVSVRGSR
jgi:hypothetical protein